MKICTKCRVKKPLHEYNKSSSKKDGLQNACRLCSKKRSRLYYMENRKSHIARVSVNKKRHVESAKEYVWAVLLESSCKDCGASDPRILDFDHLSDKSHNVSDMQGRGYSVERIQEEIDKCEVVCSNCHRIRTFERSGSWRQRRFVEDF